MDTVRTMVSPGTPDASPTVRFPAGTGVAVGDSGVGVGGTGVAVGDSGVGVGDSGVGVGGTGVGVGDSGVGVGGTGVAVGDSGVGVGDSGVGVGGTGVGVGVSGTGVGVSGTAVGVSGTAVGVSGTAVGVSWAEASTAATRQTQSPNKKIPSALGILIVMWPFIEVMDNPLSLTVIQTAPERLPHELHTLCRRAFLGSKYPSTVFQLLLALARSHPSRNNGYPFGKEISAVAVYLFTLSISRLVRGHSFQGNRWIPC